VQVRNIRWCHQWSCGDSAEAAWWWFYAIAAEIRGQPADHRRLQVFSRSQTICVAAVVPLIAGDSTIGALVLYGAQPAALSEKSLKDASRLGAVVAAAVALRRRTCAAEKCAADALETARSGQLASLPDWGVSRSVNVGDVAASVV